MDRLERDVQVAQTAGLRDKFNTAEEGERGVKDGTQVGGLGFPST